MKIWRARRRDWKAEAVKQWNADPCGGDRDAPFGTPEFFERVEHDRYEKYAPWMRSVLDFERYRGQKVLEVGFGLGTDHVALARAGAWCCGIDLTPTHVEATRLRLHLERAPLRIARADAEALPFRDRSFDAVYSFGVLHHTPGTQVALREIYRVLRPGGEVIVGVYHRSSLFFWYLILNRGILHGGLIRNGYQRTMSQVEQRRNSDAVPLVKVYTRRAVHRLFRDFDDLRIVTQHFYWRDLGRLGTGWESLVGRRSEPLRETLASWFGWYLIVRARRPAARPR